MKTKGILLLLLLLMVASMAGAVEWKNKLGAGFRGQLYAPINKGENFALHGVSYELYMLGPGDAVFARYGLTNNLVLQAELEFVLAYDDTTATKNQGFVSRDLDFAKTHLRGHLFSLCANYYFNADSRFQPYLFAGLGYDYWRINDRYGPNTYHVQDLGLKLGGGLNYWLTDWMTFEVQLKGTGGLVNLDTDMPAGFYGEGDWSEWDTRPFRNFIQPSAALAIYLGGKPDADKDGVSDDDDQCPDTPRKAKVDDVGCPIDTDSDGVYDGLDTCANTPAGVIVDGYGCPMDSDGDGVWDGWDKCPGTPPGLEVDDTGCPPDSDGDGVADYKDKCPETPLGATVNAEGCPQDSDGDKVFDGIDNCEGTPADVIVDEVGCPIAQPIVDVIVLSESLMYAPAAFDLPPAARAELDGIVQSMLAYPDTRISISGFADPSGPADFNMTLSINRAEAVAAYIVNGGIDPARMTVRGFGEDPKYFITDNDTDEGKQKNRRVEIESITK